MYSYRFLLPLLLLLVSVATLNAQVRGERSSEGVRPTVITMGNESNDPVERRQRLVEPDGPAVDSEEYDEDEEEEREREERERGEETHADGISHEEWVRLKTQHLEPGSQGGHHITDPTAFQGEEKHGRSLFAAPTVLRSFAGVTNTGWYPSDNTIAASDSFVVQVVNATVRVTDTAGNQLASSTLRNFFTSVSPTNFIFDPKIVFDPDSGRFIIHVLEKDGAGVGWYLVAVSRTNDPTGSWWFYRLNASNDGATTTTNWADYPGLGVDNQAIYLSSNQYTQANAYRYAKIRILNKATVYSGGTVTSFDFTGMTNADGSSAFTIKPVMSYGTVDGEYLINTRPSGGTSVTLWKITNPLAATPTLTRRATVTIGTYNVPPDAPQQGSCTLLDDGDCRTQDAVWRDNVLYTAFTVGTNWGSGNVAAIRALEISTATNATIQNSTYGADGVYYYYPNVTADPCGTMYLSFNRSNSTQYASMRIAADPWNDNASGQAVIGTACYTVSTSANRWGDYNGIAITPQGNVWFSSQYASTTTRWDSWVAMTPGRSTLVAEAGTGGTICADSSLTLNGSASGGQSPYRYRWTPSTGLSNDTMTQPTARPRTTTVYRLEVTDACNHTAYDSVTVTVNPLPTPGIAGQQQVCDSSVAVYTSALAAGHTWRWSVTGGSVIGRSDTNAVAVRWTGAGTGGVRLTEMIAATGCDSTTPVYPVTVVPTTAANAGRDTTLCYGLIVVLGSAPTGSGGTGALQYQWSPTTGLSSPTSPNPTLLATGSGIYTLTVSDVNGCIARDTVRVTVSPELNVDAGATHAICRGTGPALLGADGSVQGGTPPYTYRWTPAAGLSDPTVAAPQATPSATTTYTLRVTDARGCEALDSVIVAVVNPLVVDAGTGGRICKGDAVTLGGATPVSGGTGSFSIEWSPATGLSSPFDPHPTARPLTTTLYTLRVQDGLADCIASDTVTVIVPPAVLSDAGVDRTICTGEATKLGGTTPGSGGIGSYTYRWEPSTGLDDPLVAAPTARPTATTSYRLTVRDGMGCTSFDTVNVAVGSAPVPSITPDANVAICTGDSIRLSAPPGYAHYHWSRGDTTESIIVRQAGAYSVEVTTAGGCTGASSDVTVMLHPLPPQPVAEFIEDSIYVTGGSPNVDFQWYRDGEKLDGETHPSIYPRTSGVYQVLAVDSNGCRSLSDGVQVTVSGVERGSGLLGVLEVSPNPTLGTCQVSVPVERAGEIEIAVTNLAGTVLQRRTERSNGGRWSGTVDLRQLPPGEYLIELRADGRAWIARVVRQ